MVERIIWIVLDSVGMGAAPDAEAFGDAGANTIAHTAQACGGLELPNMRLLGYGNIDGMEGIRPVENPIGAYGRLQEYSAGKDTTLGDGGDSDRYSVSYVSAGIPGYDHAAVLGGEWL